VLRYAKGAWGDVRMPAQTKGTCIKSAHTKRTCMAKNAKTKREIGISGNVVNRIRSLPPAHTHQKPVVRLLSYLSAEKEDFWGM